MLDNVLTMQLKLPRVKGAQRPFANLKASISHGVSAPILEKPMQIGGPVQPLKADCRGLVGTHMCSAPMDGATDFLGVPNTPCLYASFLVLAQYQRRYCPRTIYH